MGHFLFLESYYSGSHKYFADGLIKHSKHKIDIHTLPARFWKWRMRGAALFFADQIKDLSKYDGVIVSNMLSLSDLKAIWSNIPLPFILYFHENQILYPLSKGEKEDLHYGFTDITSAISADYIFFNSNYHRKAFLEGMKPFISRMPDKKPLWVIDSIQKKAKTLYPGCNLRKPESRKEKKTIPTIIWNHRWEHDKNPEDFFSILFKLNNEDVDFRLAVLGEQYTRSPKIFNEAKVILKDKIVHFGYLENYNSYRNWLKNGDIVMSTSNQENFGISVVEAIGEGCFPLLPDRLSYKELIPEQYHNLCIYKNKEDQYIKLKKLISFIDIDVLNDLILKNFRFSWENMIQDYDDELGHIVHKS